LIPGGRKSRGAAKATSNVENVIFCRKIKLIEEIYSGLTATDVELINRGKVITDTELIVLPRDLTPALIAAVRFP
jgi:hypothetical protein